MYCQGRRNSIISSEALKKKEYQTYFFSCLFDFRQSLISGEAHASPVPTPLCIAY